MEKKLLNYLESVKKFSAEKNEPAWMLEKRLDALEKADELELPKIERVRYERWPLLPTEFPTSAGPVSRFPNRKDAQAIGWIAIG